jgi:hypothetical protein
MFQEFMGTDSIEGWEVWLGMGSPEPGDKGQEQIHQLMGDRKEAVNKTSRRERRLLASVNMVIMCTTARFGMSCDSGQEDNHSYSFDLDCQRATDD